MSAGTLIQNGTNTSSSVTVSAGALLLGAGEVGALTVSGTVGPGGASTASVGRLTVSSLAMNNGSVFQVQLGDFNNTADRDWINNTGGAPSISGTATVQVDSVLLSNWDNTQFRSWNLIVGGVSSAAGFALDQTTRWNEGSFPKGARTFSLSAAGGNLVLEFDLAPTAPAVTNYMVHGFASQQVYDGQITGGQFSVTMQLFNPDGIENTNTISPFFLPNFDVWNAAGVQILTDQVFSSRTHVGNGQTLYASNASHAGYYPGSLGSYTTRVSAVSSNGVALVNAATLSNGVPMAFTVEDDDTVAPLYNAPSNVLRNGGFERNGQYWNTNWWGTAWFSPEAAEVGNFGAYIWNSESGVQQWVPMDAGTQYTLSVRARKSGSVTLPMRIKQECYGAGGALLSFSEQDMQPTLTTNWQTFALVFTSAAGTLSNRISLFTWGVGGSGFTYLDNAFLQKGPIREEALRIQIGATNYYQADTTTNGMVVLNDGDLRAVTSDNPLRIFLHGHDAGSGLSRGTTDNSTQMNLDIGTWLTDNASAYWSAESSAYSSTFNPGTSNAWRWTSFSAADVDALFATNRVRISIPDADADRPGDQQWLTNHQAGYLHIQDDDSGYPIAAWTNLLPNGGFDANGSGWTIYGWGAEVASMGFDDWAAEDGNWGLYFREDCQRGIYRDVAAGPGQVYTLTIRAKKQPGFSVGSCYIKIECFNAAFGNLLNLEYNFNALLTTEWKTFSTTVTSPVNTAWARATIGSWNNPVTGTDYVMMDNANLSRDAAPMKVSIGGMAYAPSVFTTNAKFTISSADLEEVSPLNPLRLAFGIYDIGSGLSRGSNDAATQLSVSIGSLFTNNTAGYQEHESSPYAHTLSGGATSVWMWTSLSEAQQEALMDARTNAVRVSIHDADSDRSNDRLASSNHLMGYLIVTSPPWKVIYDGFGKTAGTWLYNQDGGTGWGTNLWACGNDNLQAYEGGSMPSNSWSYARYKGNKLRLDATENGSIRQATRKFDSPFTTGVVYASWIQNFDHAAGANRSYAGLYLMSNNTELAFAGKTPGTTVAGLYWAVGAPDTNSAHEVLNGAGNDYVFVLRYDFSSRSLSLNVYGPDEVVGEEPKGYWDVTNTLAPGSIKTITGIRLKGGIDSDNMNNIGYVYFDEVRVGTNWFEVARRYGETHRPQLEDGPRPQLIYVGTNYTVGATNNLIITDGELASLADPLDFAVMWSSPSGVFMTNNNKSFNIGSRAGRVSPNWDPVTRASAGVEVPLGMDRCFTNFVGCNGALSVTTYVHGAFSITNTAWDDTYFITTSAETDPPATNTGGYLTAPNGANEIPFRRAITINSNLQFYVTDDDSVGPTVTAIRVVGTGGALDQYDRLIFFDFGGETLDTNATFVADRLECGPVYVSANSVLDTAGNPGRAVRSAGGWGPTSKYWSVTVEVNAGWALLVTNMVFDYQATASSGPNYWELRCSADNYASVLASSALINDGGNWRTNQASVSMSALTLTNEFRFYGGGGGGGSWYLDNIKFLGHLQSQPGAGFVSDSDVAHGLWTITGLVQDAFSGVYAVGHPLGPRYSLFSPEGVQLLTNKAFTTGPAVSGAGKTPTALADVLPALPQESITLGVYTGYLYVTDHDVDRIGDSLSITQKFVFTVVDDDDETPRAGTIFQGMTGLSSVPHLHGAMVVFNGTNLVSAAGNRSNRTWSVTDRMMVNAATTNVDLHFNLFDQSGYYVSSLAGASNLLVTIANFVTNNYDKFNADRSTINTVNNPAATSVWTFSSFTDEQMHSLMETTSRVTVSATDMDNDRVNDQRAFTDKFMGHILWRDNDPFGPALQTLRNTNASLNIWLGGTGLLADATSLWMPPVPQTNIVSSNQRFEVTDGQLAAVSPSNMAQFRFQAYDVGDDNILGLQRGATFTTESSGRTLTNTHMSVGTAIMSNTANYMESTAWSSPYEHTKGALRNPTSTWVYTSFSYTQVGQLLSSGPLQSNKVMLHAYDADNDRNFDQARTELEAGWLVVSDDDVAPPLVAEGVNLLLNPGFETGTGDDADNWWRYENAGRNDWAARNGSYGMAWWSWAAAWYGGFGQDVSVPVSPGQPVTFTIWGRAETGFVSTAQEAFIKMEFWSDSAMSYAVTSHVYHQLVGNYEKWSLYRVTHTNEVAGISEVKVVVGSGHWVGYDHATVHWDDASLFLGSPPLRLLIGDEERHPVEGEGTNAVFEITDQDLANLGPANILNNRGFELGLSGYTSWGNLVNSGGAAETGTNGLAFASAASTDGGCFQDHPGLPGTNYTVTIRARKQANYSAETILKVEFKDAGFGDVGGAVEVNLKNSLEADWKTFSVSGTAPAGTAYVRATLFVYDPTGGADPKEVHFDNMVLKETARHPLRLIFGAYDADSGLSRGTTDASVQMNITVQNVTTNNVADFDEASSSPAALTRSATAYSTWTLGAGMNGAAINDLMAGGDNRVSATLFDADNDRPNDRLSAAGRQFGFIRVADNDTNAPVARDLRLKNGQPLTDGDIRFGLYFMSLYMEDFSGVNTANSGDYWMPNYSLINPSGKTVHTEVAWTYLDKLPGSNVWAAGRAAPGVDYDDVITGHYAIVWSAQDLDADRPNDRMEAIHSTNFLNSTGVFLVLDDDIISPTAPSNIVLTPIYWTNVNSFVLTFDPATDASGVFEYRVSTNAMAPSAVTDGWRLPALYVTNITGLGVSNTSFEVGAAELAIPGNPAQENGWRSFSSPGGYLWYADDGGAQDGVLASRHIINDGTLGDGSYRYTLCSQDIFLGNSNRLPPRVICSGWFKGNMSHVGFAGIQGTAFIKAEGFDMESNRVWIVDNEWDNAHLAGINATTWTQSVLAITNATASTEFIRLSSGVSARGSRLALTGWWDNVTMNVGFVEIGGVTYTNAPNGITTNWFFAVDDDNDRPNDRLMSPSTNFIIMFDGVPPPQITGISAEPGAMDDATEIDMSWTPPANGGGNGSDPLSPWRAYKIYYTDDGSVPTSNSACFSVASHPELGNRLTAATTLSNFVFGVEYILAIAGTDVAGNEGPMSNPTNVLLAGFFVTQGLAEVEGTVGRADIAWTASEGREYDLLYTDAATFSDALSNRWKLAQRGMTSKLSDTGDVASGRAPPLNLGDNMRFYRAAQKDRWTTNVSLRIASEEVYVLKPVNLSPGNNWVAFPGIPDDCTVAQVFGHHLPSGNFITEGTQISWFDRGAQAGAAATQMVWLSSSPLRWQTLDNSDADQLLVPLNQGMLVTIPSNLPAQKALLIGRVPTNTMMQIIKGGTQKSPSYNFVSFGLPVASHPSNMNLLASGFKGGARPNHSDLLFKFDRIHQQISGAGIWYKTNDATWRVATDPNGAVVTTPYFKPDDGILILSSHTNDWAWTNRILYTAPTRYMSP